MTLRQRLETRVRSTVAAVVEQTLARTSLTAIDLTLVSPLLTLGVMGLLATGHLFWGGVAVILASSFDMLDGALARAKNQVSRFGAFLDSSLDRYSDALILLGLLIHFQTVAPGSSEVILTYVAAVGALLTSYTRARAEALGYDCKVGMLERTERIALIALGLLTGWLTLMLWTLAVLSHLTALQRIVHVWRQARAEQSPEQLRQRRRPLARPGSSSHAD